VACRDVQIIEIPSWDRRSVTLVARGGDGNDTIRLARPVDITVQPGGTGALRVTNPTSGPDTTLADNRVLELESDGTLVVRAQTVAATSLAGEPAQAVRSPVERQADPRPGPPPNRDQMADAKLAGVGGQNLLRNGGFEKPLVGHGWTDQRAGGGEFVWIVDRQRRPGGRVEVKRRTWNGISEGGRKGNDDQSVDLDFRAIMYQDFRPMPGAQYELTFWFSHNPEGGHRSSSAIVRVIGAKGTLLEDTVTHDQLSSKTDMKFTQYRGSFRADAPTARLEFESLVDGVFGFVIDGVQIRKVVTAP
jgi:hypothetical protein